MRTPSIYEPVATTQLAQILQTMTGPAIVAPEPKNVFPRGRRPDLLITAPGRAPIVIEARQAPADHLERDALARFDLHASIDGRPLETVIALRYPETLTALDTDTPLQYAAFTRNPDGAITRFPQSGWLSGNPPDLAGLLRLLSVPQSAVDTAAAALEHGINAAAQILDETAQLRPAIPQQIAQILGMDNVPQTRRMACAIIANALIFHERIAGMHPGIAPLRAACGPQIPDPQHHTLLAWTQILQINYWPIFAIGKDLLEQLPAADARRLLHQLRDTAAQVNAAGVDHAHDLTGRVFQRLISDRKYLATFYTLPPSAALLARLAVAKMNPIDWSDPAQIAQLRIADFACGTGALLSAVYEQIAARHEQHGGQAPQIHPAMMEEVLYGCDVMPSAIHITGSTLSGLQPETGFRQSRLYTMPYGRQTDGSVKIGSLEFLQSSAAMTLFNTSNPAQRTGSAGEETAAQIIVDIPDAGYDLIIMNPPFTRATNHEGAHAHIVNPAFAAFNASKPDMDAMGQRLNQLGKNSCYHGNAGIASAFAALAHRKLKPGGVIALVLPLSAAAGLSWQAFRQTLKDEYTDLTILSIAANGKDMSFSSDTGMAECLIIARKRQPQTAPNHRAHFISLKRRPAGFAPASAIAGNIANAGNIRKIEDGPYAGTRLTIGDQLIGEMLTAPNHADNESWGSVRLSDYSLAQTAYALTNSKLWLPGHPTVIDLKTARLGEVGRLGLVDRDIIGPKPRGPFDKISPSDTSTYPTLWNHKAKKETRMICLPDAELRVRQGMEAQAATAWETASRTHINREFTFNSQPLTVAFTEQKSMGGTAWPNTIFDNEMVDYAFAVWGNSTLGLLLYWWHSSRQQSSKARMTVRLAETMPVLDFRALSDQQLTTAENIFHQFRQLELKPAYLADADPHRAQLDRRLICDLLNLPETTYQAVRRLTQKLCAEPSIHGNKPRPPKTPPTE